LTISALQSSPDNRASARVLEKAGLRYEKDAFFYGTTVRYFARRRGGEESMIRTSVDP
jgi:RimJ/RimL family protein N-acetyltransferase